MICLSSASYWNMSLDQSHFCLVPGPDDDVCHTFITALIGICFPSSAASFPHWLSEQMFFIHQHTIQRGTHKPSHQLPTLLTGLLAPPVFQDIVSPLHTLYALDLLHPASNIFLKWKHLLPLAPLFLTPIKIKKIKPQIITETGNSSILLRSKGLEHRDGFKPGLLKGDIWE